MSYNNHNSTLPITYSELNLPLAENTEHSAVITVLNLSWQHLQTIFRRLVPKLLLSEIAELGGIATVLSEEKAQHQQQYFDQHKKHFAVLQNLVNNGTDVKTLENFMYKDASTVAHLYELYFIVFRCLILQQADVQRKNFLTKIKFFADKYQRIFNTKDSYAEQINQLLTGMYDLEYEDQFINTWLNLLAINDEIKNNKNIKQKPMFWQLNSKRFLQNVTAMVDEATNLLRTLEIELLQPILPFFVSSLPALFKLNQRYLRAKAEKMTVSFLVKTPEGTTQNFITRLMNNINQMVNAEIRNQLTKLIQQLPLPLDPQSLLAQQLLHTTSVLRNIDLSNPTGHFKFLVQLQAIKIAAREFPERLHHSMYAILDQAIKYHSQKINTLCGSNNDLQTTLVQSTQTMWKDSIVDIPEILNVLAYHHVTLNSKSSVDTCYTQPQLYDFFEKQLFNERQRNLTLRLMHPTGIPLLMGGCVKIFNKMMLNTSNTLNIGRSYINVITVESGLQFHISASISIQSMSRPSHNDTIYLDMIIMIDGLTYREPQPRIRAFYLDYNVDSKMFPSLASVILVPNNLFWGSYEPALINGEYFSNSDSFGGRIRTETKISQDSGMGGSLNQAEEP